MVRKKQFKSLDALETYVTNQLGNSLWDNHRIKDVIAEEMSQAVIDVVYEPYSPTQYDRRMDEGGLSDVRNVETVDVRKSPQGIAMTIENLTEGDDSMQGKFITDMIEEGRKEDWNNPYGKWSEPRPFIELTMERLAENPEKLKDALRESLKDLGFHVR